MIIFNSFIDMEYLVSILVPIYKVEKHIEKCVRSLMEQTYSSIEYIFVDDCSPDGSIEVLNRVISQYPKRKSNCRIIKHERNRGLSAARNTAIENANGLFVSHVDSDDWLEKEAISILVAKQIETDADIVSGNALQVLMNGTKVVEEPTYCNKDEMMKGLLDFNSPLNHTIWRRLIRLSLYKENNIRCKEGTNQGEDFQVMPQLVYYSNKVEKVDHVVYNYNCMNENSYMNNLNHNVNLWRQNIGSHRVVEDFFKTNNKGYKKEIEMTMGRLYINYLYCSARRRERDLWNEMKSEIIKLPTSIKRQIGWHGIWEQFVINNYHLWGAFLRIRSFIYHAIYLKFFRKR